MASRSAQIQGMGAPGGVLVDGTEFVPLLAEAGLRPPERSLWVVAFSPGDLDESSFWTKIGFPERPRFLTAPRLTPDSVLVASDRQFLLIVRQGISDRDRRFLIEHAFGHIALGHIRLGDDVGHWDLLAELKNGCPLRRWDEQVATLLATGEPSPSDRFFTGGLTEVAARLHAHDLDPHWLSAALLHKSYEDEIVEVPEGLAERAQLFPHQERGIAELVARLRRFNVAVLADSVGLGKTRTTCAVIRALRDQQRLARAAILAPRKLDRNWRIEFAVVGLEEGSDVVLVNKDIFKRLTPQEAASALRGIGLVVVEEAHQDLRNPGNRFHRNLRDAAGLAQALLVTATPWNNRRGDIFAILSPFVRAAPGGGEGSFECFKKGFRTGRKEFEESDDVFRRVYTLTVLQRTRRQLRELGDAGVFYAQRNPTLDVVPYKAEQQAAFRTLLGVVEAVRLPYFNPVRYLTSESDAEWRLSGTHRFFLLKRAESSMAAFRLTLDGMRRRAQDLRDELSRVKDSEDAVAKWLAGCYRIADEIIEDILESAQDGLALHEHVTRPRQRRALRLIEEARNKSRLKALRRRLLADCNSDIRLLERVEADFASLFEADPKLVSVSAAVRSSLETGQKVLLVSQFVDTAFAVYKVLLADPAVRKNGVGLVMSTAKGEESPVQVNGAAATREEVIRRFAPRAWAQNAREVGRAMNLTTPHGEKEISVLVGTDTLSVGQNLQDARVVLHLDLTWNPMVLEQRIGRLDRPRHESDDAPIEIRYFLNLDLIEAELKLKKTIDARLEATYRDTAFDDEILPGYFDLIEAMRKLRKGRADADEIAREVDALLQELATARPAEVSDVSIESRRDALNRLRDAVAGISLAESLPTMALTLGLGDGDAPEVVAEIECQAFDNNDAKVGLPSQHLIRLRLTKETPEILVDDLPGTVHAMLKPPHPVPGQGSSVVQMLRAFDENVQVVAGRVGDERNRLREKQREIRERTRPPWLVPLVQSIRSFLERLPESQYEAFLSRHSVSDKHLGAWLDALANGVDLDDGEMIERLRHIEHRPAAILDEFTAIRELVAEESAGAGEAGADAAKPPAQFDFVLEPVVHRVEARVRNIRINLPAAPTPKPSSSSNE